MRRITIIIFVLLLVPEFAFANSASSTNFIIESGVVDSGGGNATSGGFGLQGAIGQPATGISTSTSFAVVGGFLYPAAISIMVTPNAPSGLVAVSPSVTEVDLSWADNSGGSETGFSIERKAGVAGAYAQIGTVGTSVTSFADLTVAPSATYFYRVRAFSGGSYSSYSNETSVTTPASSGGGTGGSGGGFSGGGGGGGGGAAPSASPGNSPAAPHTSVDISGSAYPLSHVTILQDGQIAVQTIAGPDANFSATIGNLSAGSYVFSVYGTDGDGRRSSLFTFPITITAGAATAITGVFLSPTIDVDKSEVKQGDTLVIFGKSVPSSTVNIQVHSDQVLFLQATSSANGAYVYDLDTAALALGSHSAESKAIQGNIISNTSLARNFTVGNENVAATSSAVCPPKGDLNGDCRVNLIDFSILAYWYGQPNPPIAYRLDGTAAIDLTDFSILAYYWTG